MLTAYINNTPRQRTVIVGSEVVELTVRGNQPLQKVVVTGPGGVIEYTIDGDRATSVKRQRPDGSVVYQVYRYDEENWFRLTTEHRPGGWPGSIIRYFEETGPLPSP